MKIKSGTEELIAKYLLGDITEHEKKQLDNWIFLLYNKKSKCPVPYNYIFGYGGKLYEI
mgnify:CR=1 FL=1